MVAVVIATGATSFVAQAETNEELEAKIEALQKEVRELSRKQQATDDKQVQVEKTAVVGGATKGSFKLPGTDTSVTLGGYVKLDAVFSNPSVGADNSADLFLNPSSIPSVRPPARTNTIR